MDIVFDIGNSNIVCGIFSSEKDNYNIIKYFRLVTPSSQTTTDELAITIKNMLEHNKIDIKNIKRSIFCSVVPSINHNLTKLIDVYFGISISQVNHENFKHLNINYNDVNDLGIDRLTNIKAIEKLFSFPAIVVDFGTATTIDVIDDNFNYLGGLIIPGISISLESLIAKSSQLSKIELSNPKKILGNSTKECMQNGLYFLYNKGIDNIIDELIKKYFKQNKKVNVISTGGLAKFISNNSKYLKIIESKLTLIGLKILLDEKYDK